MTESEFWTLIEAGVPDLVLVDLGLGGFISLPDLKNLFALVVCPALARIVHSRMADLDFSDKSSFPRQC